MINRLGEQIHEREANAFAEAIRMPQKLIIQELEKLHQNYLMRYRKNAPLKITHENITKPTVNNTLMGILCYSCF